MAVLEVYSIILQNTSVNAYCKTTNAPDGVILLHWSFQVFLAEVGCSLQKKDYIKV